jgi:hypothetical protein
VTCLDEVVQPPNLPISWLQAFTTGVCDYSRPGIGQQPSTPWMTFAGGPGGQPAGPAPTSTPINR